VDSLLLGYPTSLLIIPFFAFSMLDELVFFSMEGITPELASDIVTKL
jgi:hypothetical protein